ncbi:hypothetical protein PRIPAC_88036 [Pristionchus pacificus]|uniref:BTB domain-containing protein n=1 Tax=Pristionchus pacificus TaxID=54126 RepID=A0A2A6BZG3_PRIPA|nr:hypothetical protein PRIPAC_88036 [Pristionchus pacificus]|eukprot:PDM71163.1 BTB domain-containing protein [Pristionchus pacificus]
MSLDVAFDFGPSTHTAWEFEDREIEDVLTGKSLRPFPSMRHEEHVMSGAPLDIKTNSLVPPSTPFQVDLLIEGKEQAKEESGANRPPNEWKFGMGVGDVALSVTLQEENGSRQLRVSAIGCAESEWGITTQMRVRAGIGEENMKVLDRFFRRHPSFDEGDVLIRFADGSTLRTWKALLSQASPYMALKMRETEDDGIVDVSPFDRSSFIELLLQLYPTERPIWANFKPLANAAVSFDVRDVIVRLSDHLVNYRKIALYRRLEDAAKLNLYPAVACMVEEAARTNLWTAMIHNGYDPVQSLGDHVYTHVVCPSIVRAKFAQSLLPPLPLAKCEMKAEDLLSDSSAKDPLNQCIMLMGTPFYVNRGILRTHTEGSFPVNSLGQLVVPLPKDVFLMCKKLNIPVGKVFLELVFSLYPSGSDVSAGLVRPALAYAYHLRLKYAVDKLEQALISEPVTNAGQLIDHLSLSETYRLTNLLRITAVRAEGSCYDMMKEAVVRPEFSALSLTTRRPVLDRMCSGWAHGWPMLANRSPTDKMERSLAPSGGGPPKPESDCATFRSIESNMVFEEMDRLSVEG